MDDNLVLQGERIFEEEGLIGQSEVEKGLWISNVKDKEALETEVLIKAMRIKNYSCECNPGKSKIVCSHIVTSLIGIRAHFKEKEANAPKPAPVKAKRLTIHSIIDQIPSHELISFVRHYARIDKKFSTQLKARFARRVIVDNDEEKYKSFLAGIVGAITKSGENIGTAEIRQFLKVAEELFVQYEEAISLKQYLEAGQLVNALLEKHAYIEQNSDKEGAKLGLLRVALHKAYEELLTKQLAPELRIKVLSFGVELAGRSYYQIRDSKVNLFEIIRNNDPDDLVSENALECLQKKSTFANNTDETKLYLLSAQLRDSDDQVALVHSLTKQLKEEDLLKLLDILKNIEAYELAVTFCHHLVNQLKHRKKYCQHKLLELFEIQKDHEQFIEYALELYNVSRNQQLITRIKEMAPKKWPAITKKYISQLAKSPSKRERKTAIHFYYAEEQLDELLKMLSEVREIEEVVLYDDILFMKGKDDALEQMYKKIVEHELDNFIGVQVNRRIHKLLSHLHLHRVVKLHKRVRDHIKKEYAHRKQLIKEI